MLRCLSVPKLFRMFSTKLPSKQEEALEKEREALKEINIEYEENEKKKLQVFFPDPNQKPEKKHIPQYPSNFGQSDEEETEPFFIDDLNEFQYIYTPKDSLVFDQEGYAIIYQSAKVPIYKPLKLKYCWKLAAPVLFSISITLHAYAYSTLGILLNWSFPFLMYSRGLYVRSIKLSQDGKNLKIVYKRFRLWREREVVVSVDSFKEPSGDSFIVWSLYEFPDDLKTFTETESVKRITFAKYWGNWSFFILPREPEAINREVLVNALNGIYIDTQNTGGEDIKARYLILHPKEKSK